MVGQNHFACPNSHFWLFFIENLLLSATVELHLQRCSVCDPPMQKYFSHPRLGFFFFAAPPIKLKLGHHIGGGLLPNSKPSGPIIMMGQSETLSSSQIIFITLFSAGKHWAVPVTSHCKVCTFAEPKPFSWSKPAFFLLFFIQLHWAPLAML